MSESYVRDIRDLVQAFMDEHGTVPAEVEVDDAHLAEWETAAYKHLEYDALYNSEYEGWFSDRGKMLPLSQRWVWQPIVQQTGRRVPVVFGCPEFRCTDCPLMSTFYIGQQYRAEFLELVPDV